jgi:hypothetical protein
MYAHRISSSLEPTLPGWQPDHSTDYSDKDILFTAPGKIHG